MSEASPTPLPPHPKLKKFGKGRMPLGGQFRFHILDEIRRPQSTLVSKILCLQRVEFESDKRIELRLGYYIIGKKPRMKDKWAWGQYAPFMPVEDFKYLVEEAQRMGWL